MIAWRRSRSAAYNSGTWNRAHTSVETWLLTNLMEGLVTYDANFTPGPPEGGMVAMIRSAPAATISSDWS